MKSMQKAAFLAVLAAFALALSGSPARAAVLTCTDCTTCNTQIQAALPGDTVQLTAAIGGQAADCISFAGKDNVTLDCMGNTISGTGLSTTNRAIWLGGGSNSNIVRNCAVTGFAYGIYISSSSNDTLMYATANSNRYAGVYVGSSSGNTLVNVTANLNGASTGGKGIYLDSSSGNTLANITAKENEQNDIYITATLNAHCSNNISDVSGSGNRLVKYFNYSVNLHDETLSGLILCNADNSNITNVRVSGSDSKFNNGIFAMMTDYSNFTNMNSSYNTWGANFYGSSNNRLTNITAKFNSGGMIYQSSNNNIFMDMNVSSNGWDGITFISSNGNVLSNITINNNVQGLFIQSSKNYIITNVTARDNQYADFWVDAPDPSYCNLNVSNFTASGYLPIKYFNYSVNLHDEVLAGLFLCNADYSTLTNITLAGPTSNRNNLISILNTDHSNFTNINSSFRNYGMTMYSDTYNSFADMTFNNNYNYGLQSTYSLHNTFRNITANSNTGGGISSADGNSLNSFIDITANSNGAYGFGFMACSNNIVTNLTAKSNNKGVYLWGSVTTNNIINNSRIEKNTYGIYIGQYVWLGIYSYPLYNRLYNNYINNTNNYYTENQSSVNYWNTTFSCAGGPNVIGGIPIAGNYWTNPTGTGYSDTCADLNSKGMCDSPFVIDANNTDFVPLHKATPDTLPPTIILVPPTPQNATTVPTDYIQVNISVPKTPRSCLDETPNSCLLNWYNGMAWANYTMSKSGYSCFLNMTTLSPYTVYQYKVYANDSSGNMNVSETRQNNITDWLSPTITFVPPTPPNGLLVRSNYIEVNVSLSETVTSCLLDWYDGSWNNYSMAISGVLSGSTCYINMTDLVNTIHMFRVYAIDLTGNMNVSETRLNSVLYINPANTLARFSVSSIHSDMGTNELVKVYAKNPDSAFGNVSVWLGGNYPSGLVRFLDQPSQLGVSYTNDLRNATLQLNPKEGRILTIMVNPTDPNPSGYTISLTSNTTASGKRDFDSVTYFVDYPPTFPGLEMWSIALVITCSCVLFFCYRIRK